MVKVIYRQLKSISGVHLLLCLGLMFGGPLPPHVHSEGWVFFFFSLSSSGKLQKCDPQCSASIWVFFCCIVLIILPLNDWKLQIDLRKVLCCISKTPTMIIINTYFSWSGGFSQYCKVVQEPWLCTDECAVVSLRIYQKAFFICVELPSKLLCQAQCVSWTYVLICSQIQICFLTYVCRNLLKQYPGFQSRVYVSLCFQWSFPN